MPNIVDHRVAILEYEICSNAFAFHTQYACARDEFRRFVLSSVPTEWSEGDFEEVF